MKIKLSLITILLLGFCQSACAQSRDNYNMWFQYLMSARLTDKSTLTALSQYRSFDLAYDTRLFLVSAYVDYEVANDVKPALGMMFLILDSYKSDNSKKERYEKRPFQQVSLGGKYWKNLYFSSVSCRGKVYQ